MWQVAQAAFQSLLHQGISLLALFFRTRGRAKEQFQSLLHQGISLLPPLGSKPHS